MSFDTHMPTNNLECQPKFVSGQVFVQPGEDGKTDVLLLLEIAFFQCVKVGQDLAQRQSEMLQTSHTIANSVLDQLSGYQFVTLPESEATNSNPDIGMITNINCENQRVQAEINIVQGTAGNVQQTFQVQAQQASASVQNTSQAINEGMATMQLVTQLTTTISRP